MSYDTVYYALWSSPEHANDHTMGLTERKEALNDSLRAALDIYGFTTTEARRYLNLTRRHRDNAFAWARETAASAALIAIAPAALVLMRAGEHRALDELLGIRRAGMSTPPASVIPNHRRTKGQHQT